MTTLSPKKLTLTLSALALMVGVAAFTPNATIAQDEVAVTQANPAKVFATPLLLTDVGQGNNAKLIQALMRRAKLSDEEYKLDEIATVDSLEGVKTLVIGVGASSKGLGAAGLNAQQEEERTKALIAAAKERKIPIIGVHMGGDARRGELSDGFNRMVFEASDTFILWDGGDSDGFFTRLAREHSTTLISISSKTAVGDELVKLLTRTESA